MRASAISIGRAGRIPDAGLAPARGSSHTLHEVGTVQSSTRERS
jgi:hypothetical protein